MPRPHLTHRARLQRGVVVLVLVLTAGLPTSAHAATGLTERECADFLTGDNVRKLSVCSRGFEGPGGTRGVVEMHTYAFKSGGSRPGYWVDSTSQSITVNDSVLIGSGQPTEWGADQAFKCRVDGPAGRVACSVPNVVRVAFYSPAPTTISYYNQVRVVSWRDDRGLPHTVRPESSSSPGRMPLNSPSW